MKIIGDIPENSGNIIIVESLETALKETGSMFGEIILCATSDDFRKELNDKKISFTDNGHEIAVAKFLSETNDIIIHSIADGYLFAFFLLHEMGHFKYKEAGNKSDYVGISHNIQVIEEELYADNFALNSVSFNNDTIEFILELKNSIIKDRLKPNIPQLSIEWYFITKSSLEFLNIKKRINSSTNLYGLNYSEKIINEIIDSYNVGYKQKELLELIADYGDDLYGRYSSLPIFYS